MEEWITVAKFEHRAQAEIFVGRLQVEGVPSRIVIAHQGSSPLPSLNMGLSGIEVRVPLEKAYEAFDLFYKFNESTDQPPSL